MGRDEFGYGLSAGHNDGYVSPGPDWHQEIEINWLGSGRMVYRFGGHDMLLPPGRLLVFWAAVPHQIVRVDDVRGHYWIHLPLSWVMAWELPPEFMRRLFDGVIVGESRAAETATDALLLPRWVEELNSGNQELSSMSLLEIEARLRRLWYYARDRRSGPLSGHGIANAQKNKARAMADWIARHYREAISVPEIAAAVKLNPTYAMTLFRKEFQLTISQFVNRHRIWHAQRLLATGNAQVIEVALESGFGSLSQFNAVFRELTGVSPRAYRFSLKNRWS